MVDNEKDRLGRLLHDVEKGREDQFFAQRDRELIEKLRQRRSEAAETAAKNDVQARCPDCGNVLERRDEGGVALAECPTCGGVWLSASEVERLATSGAGPLTIWLASRRR